MEPRDTLIKNQNLVRRMPPNLGTLLLNRIERILRSIILFDNKLKFLPLFFFLLIKHQLGLFVRIAAGDYFVEAGWQGLFHGLSGNALEGGLFYEFFWLVEEG